MMKIAALLLSLATLGFTQYFPSPSCTSVISKPAGCCPPVSSHTSTKTVNCHGCALTTSIVGPHCDLVCESTRTEPGTTTVTACSPYYNPGGPIQTLTTSTYLKPRDPAPTTTSPSINPGGPIQPCTSTITVHNSLACTRTSASYTKTKSVDCHGCVLTTTTVPPLGVGPVCVGGIKTVFTDSTATVTACATGKS